MPKAPSREFVRPHVWLDRREAAQYIGVTYDTMKRWASDGKPPFFHRRGRRVKYSASELDSFIETMRSK